MVFDDVGIGPRVSGFGSLRFCGFWGGLIFRH